MRRVAVSSYLRRQDPANHDTLMTLGRSPENQLYAIDNHLMNLTVYLRDFNERLVAAWRRDFDDIPEVETSLGDIFGIRADVIISPANSFGFMDGGIDLAYSNYLGWHVQEQLQETLRRDFDGELPVGLAAMIPTGHEDYPYLISAPTMRTPENVKNTLNAYLAFRAALRLVMKTNAERPGTISSVLCPGLGTATGQMHPNVCAKQMHAAYLQVIAGKPWHAHSINEAVMEHYRLLQLD